MGELRRRHIHDFLERTANCVEDLKRLEAAQWLPSSFFQWCIGLPFALTAEFTSEMQQQTRVVAPIFDVFLELLPYVSFHIDLFSYTIPLTRLDTAQQHFGVTRKRWAYSESRAALAPI